MTWTIAALGVDDVDRLAPLWAGMAAHHAQVVGDAWPAREAQASWQLRRLQYVRWLERSAAAEAPTAWLFGAVAPEHPDGPLLGYAMLVVNARGPTWDLGDDVGSLESLAVAEPARRRGIGRALMAAARATLRERGVRHWTVSVVEANADAVALYAREGLEVFCLLMLGRVDGSPR